MSKSLSFEMLLILFGTFIAVLIGTRVVYTGSGRYLFLVWNLFLAGIPYLLTRYALPATRQAAGIWAVLLAWLLFFPNALYIVTDLIHLEGPGGIMPKWFDAVLLFSASVLGLILGFASLYKVEQYLRSRYQPWVATTCIFLFLFLGSFGVYLGRFMRWNSWDVISDPLSLFSGILNRLIYPLDHSRTWGTTFMLTGLFALLYTVIKKMPGHQDRAV